MSKTISLKIDDELFNNIKRVSNLFNVSSSEFIRNEEITQLLNKLTDDDIKIVKRDIIEL